MTVQSFFFELGAGLIACLFFMFLVYVWAVKNSFYSSVDVAWSYGFGVIALYYMLIHEGWAPRVILLGSMFLLWSLRLGTYLTIRLKNHFPTEDGRYITLREKWGTQFFGPFFIFFAAQAASVAVLATPMVFTALNTEVGFGFFEIAGLIIWIAGWVGESTADAQLAKFKKDPANKGKVCDVGLWNYSRHPNYFFNWCMWVSYFTFALSAPYGWITIYCPLIMLFLFFKITGIPATEAQALKSKGEAYKRYQETTSVFAPWFKKKARL